MRASQKRGQSILSNNTITSKPGEVVNREFSFNLQNIQNIQNKAKILKNTDNSSSLAKTPFLVKDLAKSLVLAALIFSLEMVIYWVRSESAL
ncbi:MAG: hypothetical protein A2782_00880 [Candidatus Blackburnbacteria bacterium RIFCSPHIGHO2_01_FULL_43_15b]|uniref:Uncharacterized protein n=1 Tax=Candidatus Blackburnbacteria bacterium RIFCSPHIGHO2_01_FULL_43_15b TaxID=1797513 RepID=A0A1G1V0X7_9BACT|nr:MAG: hypothetical protein A2782_00880 [Candidatus Blackburnbacteria bacterium RIFCSPHIGHO2_01_FULL_43_15b]